jgi:hypothetical protein
MAARPSSTLGCAVGSTSARIPASAAPVIELRGVYGRHARPNPRIRPLALFAANLLLGPTHADERVSPQLNRQLHDSA